MAEKDTKGNVEFEALSDEDLESAAGGTETDSNVSTACCTVSNVKNACCDTNPA